MYIITASKWDRPIINKHYQTFTGSTLRECMEQYRSAQENNDLNMFLPMCIENVENTEES